VSGRIHQLSRSAGGVPKLPVVSARVTESGLEGDRQRDRRYHGGPLRALCLFSLERIAALRAEGHPIEPGSTGENVTVSGIEWEALQPGVRLRLGGEVEIEITSYTAPCKNIAGSFSEGEFTRISQKVHPGWSRLYARVHRPGQVAAGDAVELFPSG
jgi:MOSC domain-containing protein YiiM